MSDVCATFFSSCFGHKKRKHLCLFVKFIEKCCFHLGHSFCPYRHAQCLWMSILSVMLQYCRTAIMPSDLPVGVGGSQAGVFKEQQTWLWFSGSPIWPTIISMSLSTATVWHVGMGRFSDAPSVSACLGEFGICSIGGGMWNSQNPLHMGQWGLSLQFLIFIPQPCERLTIM